jgi:hypothetical protein
MNVSIVVTKFDKMVESNAVVVGFHVTSSNGGGSIFLDTKVSIPSSETGVTDNELIDSAWVVLQPTVSAWVERTESKQSPVGKVYVPTNTPTDTLQ